VDRLTCPPYAAADAQPTHRRRRCAQNDLASIEAVAELTIRLGRVMEPDYVMSWLRTGGIEALGGERPIDLIARGDIESVARVASSLEDPGAPYSGPWATLRRRPGS
jgi:hypothetical protein